MKPTPTILTLAGLLAFSCANEMRGASVIRGNGLRQPARGKIDEDKATKFWKRYDGVRKEGQGAEELEELIGKRVTQWDIWEELKKCQMRWVANRFCCACIVTSDVSGLGGLHQFWSYVSCYTPRVTHVTLCDTSVISLSPDPDMEDDDVWQLRQTDTQSSVCIGEFRLDPNAKIMSLEIEPRYKYMPYAKYYRLVPAAVIKYQEGEDGPLEQLAFPLE